MSDKLQRMLEKAKAKRGRRRASETILIACERPEDVPARVDVLIAAGKLTEADRARCVFRPPDWNGTADERIALESPAQSCGHAMERPNAFRPT